MNTSLANSHIWEEEAHEGIRTVMYRGEGGEGFQRRAN